VRAETESETVLICTEVSTVNKDVKLREKNCLKSDEKTTIEKVSYPYQLSLLIALRKLRAHSDRAEDRQCAFVSQTGQEP